MVLPKKRGNFAALATFLPHMDFARLREAEYNAVNNSKNMRN